MLFPVPSTNHRLELLALKSVILSRAAAKRLRIFITLHQGVTITVVVMAVSLLIAILFWPFWINTIPAKLSALAKAILVFVQAHPGFARTFHVVANMVPDIAYLLLAFASVNYLMPNLVGKINQSKPLRVAVFTLFMCFALLAIGLNRYAV